MHPSQELIRQIVFHDIDPDFIRTLSQGLAWAYRDLFKSLQHLDYLPNEYLNELFNRKRTEVAAQVMAQAAKKHGIPYEFFRLASNGQHKIIIKTGRIVLIQESIDTLDAHPKAAEYKLELADAHGFMRQLELDLGDQPHRIHDWSGCVLCAVLHGVSGTAFSSTHKDLGSLMLGVPDAAYQQWVLRVDLQTAAMFGDDEGNKETEAKELEKSDQVDRVVVTTKKRNQERGNG